MTDAAVALRRWLDKGRKGETVRLLGVTWVCIDATAGTSWQVESGNLRMVGLRMSASELAQRASAQGEGIPGAASKKVVVAPAVPSPSRAKKITSPRVAKMVSWPYSVPPLALVSHGRLVSAADDLADRLRSTKAERAWITDLKRDADRQRHEAEIEAARTARIAEEIWPRGPALDEGPKMDKHGSDPLVVQHTEQALEIEQEPCDDGFCTISFGANTSPEFREMITGAAERLGIPIVAAREPVKCPDCRGFGGRRIRISKHSGSWGWEDCRSCRGKGTL